LPRPRPIATTQAGGFHRATASQGEWSLEHRKGGNYGYDAILDIKRNGKRVQSIERARPTAMATGHKALRPMAKPSLPAEGRAK
jgi:hypothetical protein